MKIKTSDFKRLIRECIQEVLMPEASPSMPMPEENAREVEIMLDGNVYTFSVVPSDHKLGWDVTTIQSPEGVSPFPEHGKADAWFAFLKQKGQIGNPSDRTFNNRSFQFWESELNRLDEEQPEPHDAESDTFAPGPRQRPEDWTAGNDKSNPPNSIEKPQVKLVHGFLGQPYWVIRKRENMNWWFLDKTGNWSRGKTKYFRSKNDAEAALSTLKQ